MRGRFFSRRRGGSRDGVAASCNAQMPADGPAATRDADATAAIIVTRTLDEAIALCERMAPEHVVCDTIAVADG